MNQISKLIGIPFKIGREDLDACDCVGICWLYHKMVRGKDYPHRDGKRMKFRNKSNDTKRILSVIRTWANEVSFKNLREGDIILMKSIKKKIACLGVLINDHQVLYMNPVHGSALARKSYIKDIFIKGFRPND